MQILEINDFPGPLGGAERHFMSLCRLLEERGHRVTRFHTMEHYEKKGIRGVRESLTSLLEGSGFDIAHIHVLDHKFLFLIDALASRSIRIAQTLHDHRAICYNSTMFRDGRICTKCRGNRHFWASIHGCVNVPLSLSGYVKRGILNRSEYDQIDLFISPSDFLIKNFSEWGFKGVPVKLRNFLEMEDYEPRFEADSSSIVFFGRLSPIKGLHTLISAIRGLPVRLNVIGDGEMKPEIEAMLSDGGYENVTLSGFRQGRGLCDEIGKSQFVVVPSECYENSPYAVMEAFALGKPVVGSNLGGIAELIGSGERGVLFAPGDVGELRAGIISLLDNRDMIARLGKAARAYAEENFAKDQYYERLMELFNKILDI